MVGACRHNAGFVVDNDEEVADLGVVFEVGAQAGITPWRGCNHNRWLCLGNGHGRGVVGFGVRCFNEFRKEEWGHGGFFL